MNLACLALALSGSRPWKAAVLIAALAATATRRSVCRAGPPARNRPEEPHFQAHGGSRWFRGKRRSPRASVPECWSTCCDHNTRIATSRFSREGARHHHRRTRRRPGKIRPYRCSNYQIGWFVEARFVLGGGTYSARLRVRDTRAPERTAGIHRSSSRRLAHSDRARAGSNTLGRRAPAASRVRVWVRKSSTSHGSARCAATRLGYSSTATRPSRHWKAGSKPWRTRAMSVASSAGIGWIRPNVRPSRLRRPGAGSNARCGTSASPRLPGRRA